MRNILTYNLTVALALLPGQTPPGQIEIQLLSGANLLAHFDATAAMLSAVGTVGTFTDYNASFSTLLGNDSGYLGQNLSIAIVTSPENGGVDADIDNVRLTETTVPEPSTWAMVMLGAGGLLFFARRELSA